VPRRHDLDAEPMQGGIEAEVGAVDDAGHLLDAFGLKNARQDFPAAGLRHAVFPVSSACKASRELYPVPLQSSP
jgi:hypothetical protein